MKLYTNVRENLPPQKSMDTHFKINSQGKEKKDKEKKGKGKKTKVKQDKINKVHVKNQSPNF